MTPVCAHDSERPAENRRASWASHLGPRVANPSAFLLSHPAPGIRHIRAFRCRGRCPAINSVTPAVSGGRVYVTATDGRVYALNAKQGRTVWSAPIPYRGKSLTSLAVSDGRLFIATGSGRVVALNAASGRRDWVYAGTWRHSTAIGLAAGYILRPAADKRLIPSYLTVYVTGVSRRLVAVNAANGRVRWTFSPRAGSAADPSVSNGVVYVSDTQGNLYGVNARTGRLITRVAHLKTYTPTYPAIVFNWLYVGGYGFEAPSA